MRCTVCKRENSEVELFEGVRDIEMVMVCKECADAEGIPLIRKPSNAQLEKANENYSVRERMERMSGMRKTTEISEEQTIVQSNMARLKMPDKKEFSDDLFDDYYWKVNMARRRKKLSIKQVSEETGVDEKDIQAIEKGKIPRGHVEIFLKLEKYFKTNFLKVRPEPAISFTRKIDQEKEILAEVQRKMSGGESEHSKEFQERIEKGEVDFSRREDLEKVTLNDLIDRKRRRDAAAKKKAEQSRNDAFIGDDIDLEIEEL